MIEYNLGQALEKLGWTVNKLSVFSGVRPNTIYDLVNGKTKRVEIDTLEKILTSLNDIAESRGLPMRFKMSNVLEFIIEDGKELAKKVAPKLVTDEYYEAVIKTLKNEKVIMPIGEVEVSLIVFMENQSNYLMGAGLRDAHDYRHNPTRPSDNLQNSNLQKLQNVLTGFMLLKYENKAYTLNEKGKYIWNKYQSENT